MTMSEQPIVTALYVPGDRPDRFSKAAAAGPDLVILDWEDSVATGHKDAAREAVTAYLAIAPPCAVVVRVNGSETPWHTADLEAIARSEHVCAIRLPKCESPEQVAEASRRSGGRGVQAVIESAIGIERLYDIACAEATVGVSLGEADLQSALAISDPKGLDWARGRLVIAAAAAGLPAPLMSAWTDLKDLDGLAASCRVGKAHGFFGRAAIHPAQLPAIRNAFRPTHDEILGARAVLAALDGAAAASSGVAVLPDGRMVDEAMRRGAERIASFAEP